MFEVMGAHTVIAYPACRAAMPYVERQAKTRAQGFHHFFPADQFAGPSQGWEFVLQQRFEAVGQSQITFVPLPQQGHAGRLPGAAMYGGGGGGKPARTFRISDWKPGCRNFPAGAVFENRAGQRRTRGKACRAGQQHGIEVGKLSGEFGHIRPGIAIFNNLYPDTVRLPGIGQFRKISALGFRNDE